LICSIIDLPVFSHWATRECAGIEVNRGVRGVGPSPTCFRSSAPQSPVLCCCCPATCLPSYPTTAYPTLCPLHPQVLSCADFRLQTVLEAAMEIAGLHAAQKRLQVAYHISDSGEGWEPLLLHKRVFGAWCVRV
jgi:hypothetical protein